VIVAFYISKLSIYTCALVPLKTDRMKREIYLKLIETKTFNHKVFIDFFDNKSKHLTRPPHQLL
jgi:hypothetical protein